jgi:peptidylprolyl isomerase
MRQSRAKGLVSICLLLVRATSLFCPSSAAHASDQTPEAWRRIDPEYLAILSTGKGDIAIRLLPAIAPGHVERFKELIRAHFYDGKLFYRVIEGFVAQAGQGSATKDSRAAAARERWRPLTAEFDKPIDPGENFVPLRSPDLFAPIVGFIDGVPVGRDPKESREWALHCPGMVAFARDNDPNSATTDFYIVIGQAPRQLDRNLTVFGRVVHGMNVAQGMSRSETDRTKITRAMVAVDMPASLQPSYKEMDTRSANFQERLAIPQKTFTEFFVRPPPPVLDICSVSVPVR